MDTKELIRTEFLVLINKSKESIGEIKAVTVSEAWKILQLLTATVIQIIEKIGMDLASQDKKQLAMELITKFYDDIFNIIDLPFLPTVIESMLHSYIKKILMLLVDSAIDAMVATFRDVGIFHPKTNVQSLHNSKDIDDFLKHLNNIVRI